MILFLLTLSLEKVWTEIQKFEFWKVGKTASTPLVSSLQCNVICQMVEFNVGYNLVFIF